VITAPLTHVTQSLQHLQQPLQHVQLSQYADYSRYLLAQNASIKSESEPFGC